ncbi:MAG: T9SS type A sorting domain-containing protein [Flavobacterium sp.]
MKTILLFISLLIFGSISAQITYVSSDYAAIGDNFLVSQTSVALPLFNFVQTGPNFNWNYANLQPQTQETISFINPNDAGYRTVWCFLNGFIFNCVTQFNNNFNLASPVSQGFALPDFGVQNVVEHYRVTANNVQAKMIGAQVTVDGNTLPLVVDYTQPDILYQFPLNYLDTHTNTSVLNLNLSTFGFPVIINQVQERTNLVEGWGSLVTPFGTFSQVLKIKTTINSTQTITFEGEDQVIENTTIIYKWLDKNYGVPVLEVSGEEVGGIWAPLEASYIDIQRCLEPLAAFLPFPPTVALNPDNLQASVTFINASQNYDSLIWDFGDGTSSTATNPTKVFTCPGLKEVTLTITNEFCDPNQTDAVTIPVFIADPDNIFTDSVTVTPTSLIADRDYTGTTYQWIDCTTELPISGATAQEFTPLSNGSYAVLLTTKGCISQSDCIDFETLHVGEQFLKAFQLYPNPTTGVLNTNIPTESISDVSVYTVSGIKVGRQLDLTGLASGYYFIKVTTEQGSKTFKIIKE